VQREFPQQPAGGAHTEHPPPKYAHGMGTLVRRDRLLATLRLRHELTLCGLVAPAGFGRTVVLDQAGADLGPEASDIRYTCSPRDACPGELAARLSSLLTDASGDESGDHRFDDVGWSVAHLSAALAACDRRRPTALCLDRFELAGEAGAELLRLLVADAPPGVHIVVSARRLGHVGLGRLVVAGKGCLLGWRDLAFDAAELALLGVREAPTGVPLDEPAVWPALAFLQAEGAAELITGYLQDEVLADEPAAVVRALAALAAIGGCTTDDLADATAPVLEGLQSIVRDDVLDRVAELPLVGRGPIGCWPHPVWVRATRSTLDRGERRLVVDARIAALLDRGAVSEAGRMAVEVAGPDALRAVVRSALATMPVSASVDDQRAWQRSELLADDLPERLWLDAVLRSREDDEPTQFERLEEVRKAFEAREDLDGETGVLLQLGNLARAQGDLGALVALLTRAEVLAARGDERARSLVALGQAISAQLAGRPDDAVRAVDSVAPGSLPADWAAQALMIRGVNLLLGGRFEAAVTCLEAATGEGSEGSLAIAHDLLSTARWQAGDPHGALDDAALSVSHAARVGPPARLQLSQAWLACLLAATGQDAETNALLVQMHGGGPLLSSEGAALTAVAQALLRIDDPDAARSLLESADVLDRPVRSSLWRHALLEALSPVGAPTPRGPRMPGFDRAIAAGAAGQRTRAGGPAAESHHRPYLPARWCVASPASTTVSLFGIGTVRRDHRVVDHPAWQRGRVRELCLHLAVVNQTPRSQVAATLWPERDERSAGQNLRVTLSHLLDVLDPDRARSQGSQLVRETSGAISLDPQSGLRVDVWEVQRHADFVMATPDDQRASVLAHARRLLAVRKGPLLDATPVGDWCNPYRRRLDDLVLNAACRAGDLALHCNDLRLAVDLGRLALDIDPWSEAGHRLIIEGRLSQGDVDGARRAQLEAIGHLDDLGVAPGRALVLLGYRLGLTGTGPTRAVG
jgi:DNA-binding SARP family transcriptional activator/tetratricopeptide (TPR) repeat protein